MHNSPLLPPPPWVFWGRLPLCSSGWLGTHCVAQADLKLLRFSSPLVQCRLPYSSYPFTPFSLATFQLMHISEHLFEISQGLLIVVQRTRNGNFTANSGENAPEPRFRGMRMRSVPVVLALIHPPPAPLAVGTEAPCLLCATFLLCSLS